MLNFDISLSGAQIKKYGDGLDDKDYLGGLEFIDEKLAYISHGDGRIVFDENGLRYQWIIKDHLGNNVVMFEDINEDGIIEDETSENENAELEVIQRNSYYAFGLEYGEVNESSANPSMDYKYNGKELHSDFDLGWSNYGARFYDPAIARFTTIDPLTEQFPHQSGYVYADNDPVGKIDFMGLSGEGVNNPIYGLDGTFLGTDNKGLKGEAIVMDEKFFNQGMSHDDASDLGFTVTDAVLDGTLNADSFNKVTSHFDNLSSRPDYDGKLTKKEADEWWRGKSGNPLYVDQSKIKLPGVTTADFENKNGSSKYKNFIWSMSNTGKVYGTLKMTLTDATKGTVFLGGKNRLDEYDFGMDGRVLRNFATWAGRPGGKNDGKSFLILSYGMATVPVKK